MGKLGDLGEGATAEASDYSSTMVKRERSTVLFRSIVPAIVALGAGILLSQFVRAVTIPAAGDEASREDTSIGAGMWIIFLMILMLFLAVVRSILLRGRERGRAVPSRATGTVLLVLYAAALVAVVLFVIPNIEFAVFFLLGALIVVSSWAAVALAVGDADPRNDSARTLSTRVGGSPLLAHKEVAVPAAEVPDLVRASVVRDGHGASGWPIEWLNASSGVVRDDGKTRLRLTFTPIDEAHSRIEVEVMTRGQGRLESVHRLFAALDGELTRRALTN